MNEADAAQRKEQKAKALEEKHKAEQKDQAPLKQNATLNNVTLSNDTLNVGQFTQSPEEQAEKQGKEEVSSSTVNVNFDDTSIDPNSSWDFSRNLDYLLLPRHAKRESENPQSSKNNRLRKFRY